MLLSSLLLMACDTQTIYSHYESVDVTGWSMLDTLRYTFEVTDTLSDYEVLIHVRHTEAYPYQNMWLFVDNDTIEFYLADERGQWLGNGRNSLVEMPILYEQSISYDHAGERTITICHAMRDSLLRGVSDVGVSIIKNGKE